MVQRVDILLQICDRCGAYELWEEHFLREKKQQSWVSFSGRRITVDRLSKMGSSVKLLLETINVPRKGQCQNDGHVLNEYSVPVMVDASMLS